MATQGPVPGLLDELIQTFTCLTQDSSSELNQIRQKAQVILKDYKSGRTNQFAIKDHYEGLEEKARVNNNDELADALHPRVEALTNKRNKWTPELLSLLFELSDDPVRKSSPDDLNLLERADSPPPLTWEDIIRDDPLDNDDGLWDNVDFGEESSVEDEDISVEDFSVEPDLSVESMTSEEPSVQIPAEIKSVDDIEIAESIRISRLRWQNDHGVGSDRSVKLSETQITRESIFMLLGLPCDAYVQGDSDHVRPNTRVQLDGVSGPVLFEVLAKYSEIGNAIAVIRKWAGRRQELHILQSFQASLNARLNTVDMSLSDIENRIIHTSDDPMTLMSVYQEIQLKMQHLVPLSTIVENYQKHEPARPFYVMEALFRMICASQSMGDLSAYYFTASVFTDVFETYLRPYRKWMSFGELGTNETSFFVKEAENASPLKKLWSEQFSLVYSDDGSLYVPDFLHLTARKVFVTGKSVRFLRALGEDSDDGKSLSPLDLASALKDMEPNELLPFQELFDAHFNGWIAKHHSSSSNILRKILSTRCGLGRDLDAIEHIYLGSNGAVSDDAVRPIFQGIESARRGWDDQHVLTCLFRESFRQLDFVIPDRISVRSNINQRTPRPSSRSIHRLETIEVNYLLPWATSNIIQEESMLSYQNTSVFLLQIQRAKQLLDAQTLRDTPLEGENAPRIRLLLSFLRHRLRWYVDTLRSYFSIALPLTIKNMRTEMDSADDIDAMIAIHSTFAQTLEMRSLVSSKLSSTHQAIVSLLDLVVVFSDTCNSVQRTRIVASLETDLDGDQSQVTEEALQDERGSIIKLENLLATYSRLVAFILSGVREAARKEGYEFLKMLADNLEFGVKTQGSGY